MSTVVAARRITAEEFLEHHDTRGLELVDGEIVEVPVGFESNLYSLRLAGFLAAAAGDRGVVFPNDTGIQVWAAEPDKVRKPDGGFISWKRLEDAGGIIRGWLKAVPELVFEVISPGDRIEDFERKLDDYATAGIPLVWVLLPGIRSVDIYRPGKPRERLGPGDTLTGEHVLPGFTVGVADLFRLPAAPEAT